MMSNKNTGGWVILISLLIAFLLTVLPLPSWAVDWRPAWVVMLIIYWCVALPERLGIGFAWCVGLLLDVQQGCLLGENALSLAMIAYFLIWIHKRFRMYSLIQQSCLVGFIVMFYLFISLWVREILGIHSQTWIQWMPVMTTMILWPWLFVILRDIRRKYNVT